MLCLLGWGFAQVGMTSARVSETALSVRVVEMVSPLSARGSPALLTFRYAGF